MPRGLGGIPFFNGKPYIGRGLFADGSSTAPSIAFQREPTLGFFRSATGTIAMNTSATLAWSGRTALRSQADGVLELLNNAGTGFTRLALGQLTSAFPAWKRQSANFEARLADDSAFCNVSGNDFIVPSTGQFQWSGRGSIVMSADGIHVLRDNASTGYTRLCFGAATNLFPALTRNSTLLSCRLGDSSDWAPFSCGAHTATQPTLGSTVSSLTTVATNDDPTENTSQGRATTTDATVTTLQTITIPASTTVNIVTRVVARRTGGAAGVAEDGAAYERVATVKNVAGTATLIGAVATPYTMEDQAGWDCTIDVTGATARVRVTGAINNNVTWHATTKTYAVSS